MFKCHLGSGMLAVLEIEVAALCSDHLRQVPLYYSTLYNA